MRARGRAAEHFKGLDENDSHLVYLFMPVDIISTRTIIRNTDRTTEETHHEHSNQTPRAFQAIEHTYNSQHYGSGDYIAKVRALHHLLQRKAIDRLAQRLERFIQDSGRIRAA
jgi:hypothetical protein